MKMKQKKILILSFGILLLGACSANPPIQPTGPASNTLGEAAALASNPICQSVRSTFLGGGETNTDTSINAIVVGNNGNVYVAGTTNSPRLPGTQNRFQSGINPNAFSSAFVAEFSGDLRNLIAATYFGRAGVGEGRALVIGREGQIYVAGQMDWGRTFVAELTPDLKTLQNFILAKAEPIRAMAIAPNGDVYVAGGGSVDTSGYAYVVKYSSDLYQLGEYPVLGGSGRNWASAIVVAPTGEVYVAGGTTSANFPGTGGGAQSNFPSSWSTKNQAFIVELSADLAQQIQATYFGGNGSTEGTSLAVASRGQVYMGGYTSSSNLPETQGAAQPELKGNGGGFITELAGNLKSILKTTYLGADFTAVWGMELANNDELYVTGMTNSANFPKVAGGVQDENEHHFIFHPTHGFISKVSAGLKNFIQSSYYSGTDYNGRSYEESKDISLGDNGYIYIAGYTQSTSLPCGQLGALTTLGDKVNGSFIARLPATLRANINN